MPRCHGYWDHGLCAGWLVDMGVEFDVTTVAVDSDSDGAFGASELCEDLGATGFTSPTPDELPR